MFTEDIFEKSCSVFFQKVIKNNIILSNTLLCLIKSLCLAFLVVVFFIKTLYFGKEREKKLQCFLKTWKGVDTKRLNLTIMLCLA